MLSMLLLFLFLFSPFEVNLDLHNGYHLLGTLMLSGL